jgi:N,N'-diacetyllegionaminate synthase
LATEAGADAIKFQILDPDRLVADKKQLFSYDVFIDRDT